MGQFINSLMTLDLRFNIHPKMRWMKFLYLNNLQAVAHPLVQTFDGEELPQVDLKGHTVEELAAAANVTVATIQEAIKLRQQQLLLERRNYASQMKRNIASRVTIPTTPATTSIRTTQMTTTTQRSTTPYVQKKKASNYYIAGGHKARNLQG